MVGISSPLNYNLYKTFLPWPGRKTSLDLDLWDWRSYSAVALLNIPVIILFQYGLIRLTVSAEKLIIGGRGEPINRDLKIERAWDSLKPLVAENQEL